MSDGAETSRPLSRPSLLLCFYSGGPDSRSTRTCDVFCSLELLPWCRDSVRAAQKHYGFHSPRKNEETPSPQLVSVEKKKKTKLPKNKIAPFFCKGAVSSISLFSLYWINSVLVHESMLPECKGGSPLDRTNTFSSFSTIKCLIDGFTQYIKLCNSCL